MRRTVLLIVAGVLIVFGAVFGLQGIGVLGGSAMSGKPLWAFIGPIMIVIGIVLGVWTVRRGARSS